VTLQRDVGGSHQAVTSPSGNSGRIMMTPQATGTSTFVSCRRGMLTPLEHEMADEVHSPEEEQRFTHVSFRYYHWRRANRTRCSALGHCFRWIEGWPWGFITYCIYFSRNFDLKTWPPGMSSTGQLCPQLENVISHSGKCIAFMTR
jgi:hypothetical protein